MGALLVRPGTLLGPLGVFWAPETAHGGLWGAAEGTIGDHKKARELTFALFVGLDATEFQLILTCGQQLPLGEPQTPPRKALWGSQEGPESACGSNNVVFVGWSAEKLQLILTCRDKFSLTAGNVWVTSGEAV